MVVPPEVDNYVAVALRKGMRATEEAWGQINPDDVERINTMLDTIRQQEKQHTIWSRVGVLLWAVMTGQLVTKVCAYTLPTPYQKCYTLYSHTRAKLMGGFAAFMRKFSTVKLREPRWFTSSWFPGIPTYIPA